MNGDPLNPGSPPWQTALAGNTVLVTGGSGFVGGAIVAAMAGDAVWRGGGGRVVALCRNVEKGRRKLARYGDAVMVRSWRMGATPGDVGPVDAIIHAAGCGNPGVYVRDPATLLRDDLAGCVHLLEYACDAGVGRFVYISSGEVYGASPKAERFSENEAGGVDPLSPRAAYPMARLACECLCLAFRRQRGLSTSIARLCHVYGPGMERDDPRIAAQFSLAAAAGRDIVMKSRGEQLRALCYVTDAAAGVLTVLANGDAGAAYNIADEASELTVLELAERLAALGGIRVAFDIPSGEESAAFNPMPRAVFATDRLRALGWRAAVGLEAGLGNTMRWFQEYSDMEQL